MTKLKSIAAAVLIAAAIVLPAKAVSGRYAIDDAQVASALSSFGVPTKPEDVVLPTEIVAAVPNPVLHVRSLQHLADQRVMARLECERGDQCLPFVVILSAAQNSLRESLFDNAPTRASSVWQPRQFAVRNGAMAILVLDGAHVHIQIPAVSLENGVVGQTIRVREKEGHRIFTAQVVQSGLLRGRI